MVEITGPRSVGSRFQFKSRSVTAVARGSEVEELGFAALN